MTPAASPPSVCGRCGTSWSEHDAPCETIEELAALQQQLADLTVRCARAEGERDEALEIAAVDRAGCNRAMSLLEAATGVASVVREIGFAMGREAAAKYLLGCNGFLTLTEYAQEIRQLKPDVLASTVEGKPAPECSLTDSGSLQPVGRPPTGMPELPPDVAGDPPYYASKARFDDLPRPGEAVCRGATGLGKQCVLRSDHPGSHCSRTGTEWPR